MNQKPNQINIIGIIGVVIVAVVVMGGLYMYVKNQQANIEKDNIAQAREQIMRENIRRVEKKQHELEWKMMMEKQAPKDDKNLEGTAQGAFNKGWALMNQGKYDEAILKFNEAIRLDPKFVGAYDNRGTTYFLKGDYVQAISDLTKAVELKPGNGLAYSWRMAAYLATGEYDKAWADVHQAGELGYTPDAKFMELLRTKSGKDESKGVNPQKVLQEANYAANKVELNNHPEWQACKADIDCVVGGIGCEYVPINQKYIKESIMRTVQEMYTSCSDIKDSHARFHTACVNSKCEFVMSRD